MRSSTWPSAKRQAVGIFRAASREASLNHNIALYSGGDYRVPDAAKSCYLNGDLRNDQEIIRAYLSNGGKVIACPVATNSKGNRVQYDSNKPRSGCDPRTRGELIPGRAIRAMGVLSPRYAR